MQMRCQPPRTRSRNRRRAVLPGFHPSLGRWPPAAVSPAGDAAATPRRQDAPWRRRRLKITPPTARIAKGVAPAGSDILRSYRSCRSGGPGSSSAGQNHHELRAARPARPRAAPGPRRLRRGPQALELGHADRGLPRAPGSGRLSLRRLAVRRLRVVVGELRPRQAGAARQGPRRPRSRPGEGGEAEAARRWRRRPLDQADRRARQGTRTLAAGPRPDRHLAWPVVGQGVVRAAEERCRQRQARNPVRPRGPARGRRRGRPGRGTQARAAAARSGIDRLPLRGRARPGGRPLPRGVPRAGRRGRRAGGPLRAHRRPDRAARRLRRAGLEPDLRLGDGLRDPPLGPLAGILEDRRAHR